MPSSSDQLVNLLIQQSAVSDPVHYARVCSLVRNGKFKGQAQEVLTLCEPMLTLAEEQKKWYSDLIKNIRGNGEYRTRKKGSENNPFGLESEERGEPTAVDILASSAAAMEVLLGHAVRGCKLIVTTNLISLDQASENTQKDLKEAHLGDRAVQAFMSRISENRKDALQELAAEQQINRGATTGMLAGVDELLDVADSYAAMCESITIAYRNYYHFLRNRHQTDGVPMVKISGVPSAPMTDLAILIWNNVDKMGEIEHGTTPDEISVYTVQRITKLMESLRRPHTLDAILDPVTYLTGLMDSVLYISETCLRLAIDGMQAIGADTYKTSKINLKLKFRALEEELGYMPMDNIVSRPPTAILSKSEKFAMDHLKRALQRVSDEIEMGADLDFTVKSLLSLKREERRFLYNVNSFFVCKIGQGNNFGGVAPGALEVIPGQKPHASIQNVWGSGFDELRDFMTGMKDAEEWASVFQATSPSGTTDKPHILLVGPLGCGKTGAMSAVCNEPANIVTS